MKVLEGILAPTVAGFGTITLRIQDSHLVHMVTERSCRREEIVDVLTGARIPAGGEARA